MNGSSTPPPLGIPAATAMRLRVFSTTASQPRFRRATDVFLLVPALIGIVALVVAYPPSRFERALDAWLQSIPAPLDPVWTIFYELLVIWAVSLIVLSVVARRPLVWLPAIGAAGIAIAFTALAGRIAVGEWQNLSDGLRNTDPTTFPALRIAVCGALILAIGPHLTRPFERAGRWFVILSTVGAILSHDATVSGALAAVLTAVVAATVIRLAIGTSAGHPRPEDVLAALQALGVQATELEPTARQAAGVFVARGPDAEGRNLLVKVYGRDAYDTQLLEKLWRSVLYRSDGSRLRLSRLDAVEHEALVTLLAGQAGVPTSEVVIAAESPSGDALLVLHDAATPLGELAAEEVTPLLPGCWEMLARLAAAGIAHNRLNPETVAAIGDGVGFVDLDRGTIAPRADQRLLDRAQLLATTAALVGSDRAITGARDALGADELAALVPYLQAAAFGPTLRRALREAPIDVDELREAAAESAGVEPPDPIKLRRVTWWTLAQVALLALAVSTLVGAITGLDHDTFRHYLAEATWGWIVLGFFVAQLPRLTQAIATLGSVPAKLPFVPVYAMQLATGYMNLALPSNFARMAINIRFFQRQGIAPTTAVTAGAIDSFASTVIQAILLLSLLVLSVGTLDFQFDVPSGPSVRALVTIVCLALASAGGAHLAPAGENAHRRSRPSLVARRPRDARGSPLGQQAHATRRRQPGNGSPVRDRPRDLRPGVRVRRRHRRSAAHQHLRVVALELRSRARRDRRCGVRAHGRAGRGGTTGRGRARGGGDVPHRNLLRSAALGVFRDALAHREQPPLTPAGPRAN